MSMQDDALGISCPICHAPVDIQCVRIVWDAKDGQYIPRLIQRFEAHGKRVRAFEKFRYEGSDDQ
jgi:hypothetical protein